MIFLLFNDSFHLYRDAINNDSKTNFQLDICKDLSIYFVFYFLFSFSRSGSFTNILLVLVISITCVQTKEIKNSSVFPQISETNHSSIENSSASNYRLNNNAHDNQSAANVSAHQLKTHPTLNGTQYSNATKTVDQYQSSLLSYALNIHSNYADDRTKIGHINELAQSELPTAIESKSQSSIDASEQAATERFGKDSNLFKSALRVAARQGLEAMVELYNKKEPNLIKKGQLIIFYHSISM